MSVKKILKLGLLVDSGQIKNQNLLIQELDETFRQLCH